MSKIEKWKDIKNYEGLYQVSNLGNVKSLGRYKRNHSKLQKVEEKLLKLYTNKTNGYVYVVLTKNAKEKNIRVHRLVAEAFITNKNNLLQINHINGIKNDNRVENLEWCTCKENISHAYRTGLFSNKNKIKINQFDKEYNFIKQYSSLSEASSITGISIGNISQCVNKKRKTTNGFIFERS